jgi:hypothetical protein
LSILIIRLHSFYDIHLLISEQDVLRTNETATQTQMLAHSNDLVRDMHALTLVSCDAAFVQFQAANQDPVIGRLEGM